MNDRAADMPAPRPPNRLAWGLACAAVGVAVMAMVALHPESLRAPAWVVHAAAAAFVFAGIALIADARGATRLQRWIAIPVLLALATPAAWIAFGPGGRECTMSMPFLVAAASEMLCRGAFGLGLLLVVFVAALVAWRAWRRDAEH